MKDGYRQHILKQGGALTPTNEALPEYDAAPAVLDAASKLAFMGAEHERRMGIVNEQAKNVNYAKYESDLQLYERKAMQEIKDADFKTQDEFKQALDGHTKVMKEMGVNVLGKDDFNDWQETKGRNFADFFALDAGEVFNAGQYFKTITGAQDTLKNYADLAVADPAQAQVYNFKAAQLISGLKTKDKERLAKQYEGFVTGGEITRDIGNVPSLALKKLGAFNEGKAQFYTALTPEQREEYKLRAQRELTVRKGTYKDETLSPHFLAIAKAFDYDNDIIRNGGISDELGRLRETYLSDTQKYVQALGMDGFDKIVSEIEKLQKRTGTDYSAAKDRLQADFDIEFDRFELKDGKAKNKELDDIEHKLDFVNRLNGALANNTFMTPEEQNKAVKKLQLMRSSIGKDIEEGNIKLQNKGTYFNGSVASEAVAHIKGLTQNLPFGSTFTGELYERFYANLINGSLKDKLNSIANVDKAAAEQLVNNTYMGMVASYSEDKAKLYAMENGQRVFSKQRNVIITFKGKTVEVPFYSGADAQKGAPIIGYSDAPYNPNYAVHSMTDTAKNVMGSNYGK